MSKTKILARVRNGLKLAKITGGNIKLMSQINRLSRRPIVIGGCGRSGTTLMLSILSCHPAIFALPEETSALCPGYWNKEYHGYPKMDRIYKKLSNSEIPASCSRWCEKTPKNIRYIDYIFSYFGPDVRFIHLVRDGRDVVTSKHPKRPNQYHLEPERWIADVKAGLKHKDDPRLLTLRYEDLVNNNRESLQTICEFIEEKFCSDMTNYPECAAIKNSKAWRNKARPISNSSIGRWKKEEHRQRVEELTNNPEAAKLLKYFDYL